MTNKDILAKVKVGSIITDKRILSALKKRGLIFDYSQYGYLESVNIYNESKGYWESRVMRYLFSKGNAPKAEAVSGYSCKDYAVNEDICKVYGCGSEIEYMGCKFRTKYLDGCFNAYLQLVEKNGSMESEVNPRISLFGNVI